MSISKFVKIRLWVAWIKYLTPKLVGSRWRVQKKNTDFGVKLCGKIKTLIVRVIAHLHNDVTCAKSSGSCSHWFKMASGAKMGGFTCSVPGCLNNDKRRRGFFSQRQETWKYMASRNFKNRLKTGKRSSSLWSTLWRWWEDLLRSVEPRGRGWNLWCSFSKNPCGKGNLACKKLQHFDTDHS